MKTNLLLIPALTITLLFGCDCNEKQPPVKPKPAVLLFGCDCNEKQPPVKPKPAVLKPTQPEKPATGQIDKTDPLPAPTPKPKPTEEKLVELQFKLPRPLFRGTPKNLRGKIANLEKARKGRRPAPRVPDGVKLLSLGKSITSSESMPLMGELSMITDGEKNAFDDCFVDLGFGTQWIQIDLEEKAEIYAILIWHYHQEARVYHDVIVQSADEPDFITPKTLFNNDDDNSAGLGVGKDFSYVDNFEGKLIQPKGAKGRYLRFYSNGNTSNDQTHYIEVEVYGRVIKK